MKRKEINVVIEAKGKTNSKKNDQTIWGWM